MDIKKEIINTLQNLLGVYLGKIYSDTELKISSKEVGGKVEKINADGTLSPVEDGEYVMADIAFNVKDGVIESIVGEDIPTEVVAEEVPTEDIPTTGSTVSDTVEVVAEDVPVEDVPAEDIQVEDEEDTRVAELETKVSAMEKMLEEIMTALQLAKEEKLEPTKVVEVFSTEMKQLNKAIETIIKTPVEFSKIDKSFNAENEKQDRMLALTSMISGFNKK